jgi:hypothetical protein
MAEYLKIPQLLLPNSNLDKKFYGLWEKSFTNIAKDIQNYWNHRDQIRRFADIIIENDRLPVAKIIHNERLRIVFGKLLDIWTHTGTSGTYIDFFRTVFGDGVNVFIEVQTPRVINIQISNFSLYLSLFLTEELTDKIITEQTYPDVNDQEANLLFQQIMQDVSNADMNAFLNTVTPVGDYVNFEFLDG